MDELKKLTQQFVNAARTGAASVASPIQEVADFSRAAFIDPITKKGISGGGSLAGQRGKEADEADEAARQAKMAAIKDKLDPSKYTRVRKADGGFSFYDPSGKEISINAYSQFTGRSRADILADSENPVDLQYLNDFKKMQDAMGVMYGGNSAEKAALLKSNPSLRGRTVQDFATDLVKKYPHIYGRGGTGQAAYQTTLRNQGRQIFNTNYGAGGSLGDL